MDQKLLAVLQHRAGHERFAHFVKPQALTADAWSILTALTEWWSQQHDNVTELDIPAFVAWYSLVRHARMDKDKLAVHRALIEQMGSIDVPEEEMSPLLQGLIRRDYASRIADVALRIADGDYSLSMDRIEEALEEYKRDAKIDGKMEQKMGAFTLDALESVAGPGLNWRLPQLMETAGPVRLGDLIGFVKRPDAGGTTFLASEVTYMAQQMDGDDIALWFNNEEAGNKVRRRVVQSALGWTRQEMTEDMPGAMREYAERMGNPDRIIVYDDGKLTAKDAERAIKELKPKLIIFDQLWKVKGFPSAEGFEQMTFAFNWAREIAKEHAPVIFVHQMGVEGENKRYVGYEGLYGTKTGGPGEADLIISMGRLNDGSNTRYFWAPKNKMLTPGDESARNKRWEAQIDTQRARFVVPK